MIDQRQSPEPDLPGNSWWMVSSVSVAILMVAWMVISRFGGRAWWLVPLAPAVFAAIAWIGRTGTQTARLKARKQKQRMRQLERETRIPAADIEVRRGLPLALPSALSAILGVAFLLSIASGESSFSVVMAMLAVPILAIVWIGALLLRGSLILSMRSSGLRVDADEIPWSNVRDLGLETPYRDDPSLVVKLASPRPPQGWAARLNSLLSHGASDRRIVISLRSSREHPIVVATQARELWLQALGTQRSIEVLHQAIDEFQTTSRIESSGKRRATVFAAIFATVVLLSDHGIQADFLSSPGWGLASPWIAVALTVYGAYRLVRRFGLASLHNRQSTVAYLFFFVAVLMLVSGMTWLVIGRSLPDLFTRVAGTGREFTAELVRHEMTRGERCRNYLDGAMFRDRFPNRYCITAAESAAMPEAGWMRVIVRESWFGMHIDRIEPIDQAFRR